MTGTATIKLKYAEKPTETDLSFNKKSYSGENTRDTLELQSGVESIECLAKNANPDPIIELRIDGNTVNAPERSCTGDRSSV